MSNARDYQEIQEEKTKALIKNLLKVINILAKGAGKLNLSAEEIELWNDTAIEAEKRITE